MKFTVKLRLKRGADYRGILLLPSAFQLLLEGNNWNLIPPSKIASVSTGMLPGSTPQPDGGSVGAPTSWPNRSISSCVPPLATWG